MKNLFDGIVKVVIAIIAAFLLFYIANVGLLIALVK